MSWVKQHLKRVGEGDFSWLDDGGMSWNSPEDAIGIKLLGFCGCGVPEAALRYVRDAMRLIRDKYGDTTRTRYEDYRKAADALFHGDEGIEYAMWYWLHDKELAEHGGSVPGWLTPLGEDVLADLESFDLDAPEGLE